MIKKLLSKLFKNKKKIVLITIIVIAFVLRFYKLGQVPIGLEWDEVAIGYDSYSILKTGRDQFGKFLPITFRSLDDYKPPLYNYFAILPIALFGLNEFAVRFPSAFFGTISVLGAYLLVREMFDHGDKGDRKGEMIALASALFFAVSPWHLQFSRAAFEVNLSLTFIIFGVYAFLRGIYQDRWLSFSALFFGMGIFSYHSSRIIIPILLTTLIFLFYKQLVKKGKSLIKPVLILSVFFVAFAPIALSPEAQIRFRVTNFLIPAFPYEGEVDYQLESASSIEQDIKAGSHFWGRLFHNRRIAFINYDNATRVLRNYLLHFHPKFLFVQGDAPLHHAPGFGLLYVWDIPFLLLGVFIFFRKYRSQYSLPLLIWILAAPIPASVTRQVPHSVRTELILPTFHIFTALGFVTVARFIWKEARIFGMMFLLGVSSIFIFNFGYYLHQYYIHTNYELSDKWFYGRKEAALFVDSIKNNYKKVIVSTSLEQPHAFFLFYLKYDPVIYLQEGGTASGGWAEDRNKFDKYEFKPIDFAQMSKEKNLLFVGLSGEFPPNANVLKTIYYINGKEGIKIVAS